MRVNIVLPRPLDRPVGGYMVAYKYATQLAARGHTVSVVHQATDDGDWWYRGAYWAKELGGWLVRRERPAPWFPFSPDVRFWLLPSLRASLLPPADVTLLTSWLTSEAVRRPGHFSGPLVQLVYDYEFWFGADAKQRSRIERALQQPAIAHIATSGAVVSMLAQCHVAVAAKVTAGVDMGIFGTRRPLCDRGAMVGFPLRREPHKGTQVMVAAIELLRTSHPGTHFGCFGAAEEVVTPPEVDRLGQLSTDGLVDFYNQCSVFVLPSLAEGWGLPAIEAMACGTPVVTTDNGGSADFAVDEHTALVVPPGDPAALARAVGRLLDDPALRCRLASGGTAEAGRHSWPLATEALLGVLQGVARETPRHPRFRFTRRPSPPGHHRRRASL